MPLEEALMTRLLAGLPRMSPRDGRAGQWNRTLPLPVQPPLGISASLTFRVSACVFNKKA